MRGHHPEEQHGGACTTVLNLNGFLSEFERTVTPDCFYSLTFQLCAYIGVGGQAVCHT